MSEDTYGFNMALNNMFLNGISIATVQGHLNLEPRHGSEL